MAPLYPLEENINKTEECRQEIIEALNNSELLISNIDISTPLTKIVPEFIKNISKTYVVSGENSGSYVEKTLTLDQGKYEILMIGAGGTGSAGYQSSLRYPKYYTGQNGAALSGIINITDLTKFKIYAGGGSKNNSGSANAPYIGSIHSPANKQWGYNTDGGDCILKYVDSNNTEVELIKCQGGGGIGIYSGSIKPSRSTEVTINNIAQLCPTISSTEFITKTYNQSVSTSMSKEWGSSNYCIAPNTFLYDIYYLYKGKINQFKNDFGYAGTIKYNNPDKISGINPTPALCYIKKI